MTCEPGGGRAPPRRVPFQPSLVPYEDAVREAEGEPAVKVKDVAELMALIERA